MSDLGHIILYKFKTTPLKFDTLMKEYIWNMLYNVSNSSTCIMHPAHNMLLLDSLYDSQSGGIFLLSEGIKFQGCGAKSILWDPLHVCICTF